MNYIWIILLLCSWVSTHQRASGLRILWVFPTTTRSHYLAGRSVLLELLARGHEVVSISPFEEQNRDNYSWIEVEVKSLFEAVPKLKEELGQEYTFFGYLNYVWRTMNTYVTYITQRPKLATFIRNDTSHFDLIIAHEFFLPVFYAFKYKYNAPLVVMSSFGRAHYILNYMGGHFEYTRPHEFSNLEYPLNFIDAFRNCIYVLYDVFGRKIQLYKYQNSLVSDLFGLKVPALEEIESSIDLVLINSHYTTSVPRANLPNIVEIGGVHIESPKPLNQELQSIFDTAEHGVILLSLGSIIDLGSQQDTFIKVVLDILGGLKQRVILKWNSNMDISKYNNIYALPWLPQNDILAHPNVKLFINHGGGLSTQEALHHGIPIICIPFQANHHQVCFDSVRQGCAIYVPRNQLGMNLKQSIQKILEDGSFKSNALEVSRRFKDRPTSALDTAIFWIEYCTRNKLIFQIKQQETTFGVVLVAITLILFVVITRNVCGKIMNIV